MRWVEGDGLRWLEADLGGATGAFSTRAGGVSQSPYESLNLGILTGDDREDVRENRHRLAAALGVDASAVIMGRQVHGSVVALHLAAQAPSPYAEPGQPLPEADGHHTATPGLALLVLVADCLPIALAGPGGVAILHCGWRGLAAGIVERGAIAVDAERAVIGPGIGPCCYEVGDEVRGEFVGLGEGITQGPNLDLGEVAKRMLQRAGVGEIEHTGLCTSCEPELFFSHRRDGERSGRQAGLVWLS